MPKDLKPSPRQMQLIDLLIKYSPYKDSLQHVANHMKISRQAVKNMLYRIRNGYVDRLEYIEWYRKKRRELNMPGRFM